MSANSKRIERIRDTTGNDAETLALMFTDTGIRDDGTVAGRLKALLEATEHTVVPGLQTGISFHDSGFRTEFKDPWPSSDNQVGHFLTAVGLSFNPAKVTESFMGRRLRDWIGADASMTDEEVALRLTIGHEKSADPNTKVAVAVGVLVDPVAGALILLGAFQAQFAACTSADVQVFRDAERGLGRGSPLDLATADGKLRSIRVDSSLRGNSYQDLLLSCFGWRLGQDIKAGKFSSTGDVAAWVRTNIKK